MLKAVHAHCRKIESTAKRKKNEIPITPSQM